MGQQPSSQKLTKSIDTQTFYQLDIRLLQKIQSYASSFPADIQQILQQTQLFFKNQPHNPLAQFIINEINDRFNSLSINRQAMDSIANNKTILEIFHINPSFLQHKFWTELQTMHKFLKFLQKSQEKYWVQIKLYQVLDRSIQTNKSSPIKTTKHSLPNPKTNIFFSHPINPIEAPKSKANLQKTTIRQPLKPESSNPTYKTQLHQPLFKKMFFYYYEQLIRAFCGSKNGIDRSNAIHYHTSIGKNILKIIAADFISEQKLFQLLFHVVKIQKTQKSLHQLEEISAEYEIYCLKHEHSISVNKQKLQKIKLFTRCYLDEMYFLTIKQAEDPQIVDDNVSGDSGLSLKTFPINRVKEKNRNM